jgi:hypothetical protein
VGTRQCGTGEVLSRPVAAHREMFEGREARDKLPRYLDLCMRRSFSGLIDGDLHQLTRAGRVAHRSIPQLGWELVNIPGGEGRASLNLHIQA